MRTSSRLLAGLVMIFFASYPVMADAQSSQTPAITLSSVQGTVVSASTSTVVVKTGENQYQVFVVDRNTARPQAVPMHAQVTVRFVPIRGDATPIADSVIMTAPPTPQVAALTGEAPPPPAEDQVPGSVRSLENSIKRQTKKYRLGIRGATALDPELFMFGAHGAVRAVLQRQHLRPSESRTRIRRAHDAHRPQLRRRLPPSRRAKVQSLECVRWRRAGAQLFPAKASKRKATTDRNPIDFSDLSLDVGFNFLIGLQSRDGLFLEMKTSAYSIPTLRFEIGYNF